MTAANDTPVYGRIYCVTNAVNGKQYVGQTVRAIDARWRAHAQCAGRCRALESAIKKYGRESFSIRELVVASSQPELDALEQLWIEKLGTVSPKGYNLRGGGGGVGRMHDETRAIMSSLAKRPEHLARLEEMRRRPDVIAKQTAAKVERWKDPAWKAKTVAACVAGRTPEVEMLRRQSLIRAFDRPGVRQRRSEISARYGKNPETQARKSASLKAAFRSLSDEERRGRAESIRAGKLAPEARAKYAATNALPEVRARRSASARSRVVSAETRLKKSLAATGKKRGPYKNCKPKPAMAAKWADPVWKAALLEKRRASASK